MGGAETMAAALGASLPVSMEEVKRASGLERIAVAYTNA